MQLTTSLVLLAGALGVAAHPSPHAHLHRDVHQKRENVHYKAIHKPLTKTTAAPTTTTAAPVATSATSSSAAAAATSSSAGSTTYVPFCKGISAKRDLEERELDERATLAQIAYTGNTGRTGMWGCNMMEISKSIQSQYQYTTTYTNVASEAYQVICFNKIGATGLINGFDGGNAVNFMLQPGESRVVAFEGNTQGSCAFNPGTVPTDPYGAWAGVWVEFDFGNTSNNEWSGADCSSLVAQAAGMSVPGCQVCVDGGGTCSAVLPGGVGINGYVKGMEAVDGTGINHPAGNLAMTVKVGYSG